MADVEGRVDTVESDVSTVNDEVDAVESDVATIQTAVDTVNDEVDAVESDVATVQSAVDAVESDVETVAERADSNSWAQYVYVQEAMDWDSANDYCASTYGTTLATIKNDDDALTIYEMLEEYRYFWVGLRDRDGDGVHEWESGYPCDADCGTQWLLDDGTALVSDECVYVAAEATGYADILRDYPCDDSRFAFACDAPVLGNRMADVEGRVDTVESDVSTVNDDVDAVESDVNDLESRVQSLENIMSGFNDAIDSESASVAAPVGLIPFPDLALYALAAINVAVLLCLFVYCVTKRMEAPTYGKVVMYDTDKV
jgi:outer membrane murein-binding lipoprotein Lpp